MIWIHYSLCLRCLLSCLYWEDQSIAMSGQWRWFQRCLTQPCDGICLFLLFLNFNTSLLSKFYDNRETDIYMKCHLRYINIVFCTKQQKRHPFPDFIYHGLLLSLTIEYLMKTVYLFKCKTLCFLNEISQIF